MNIEQAIYRLEKTKKAFGIVPAREVNEAIDTVLKELKNSISKEKIIDLRKDREFYLQQHYKEFEKDYIWNRLQELLKENEVE